MITQIEMTVLHGILAHDHENWLTNSNDKLQSLGNFPKALVPLSIMDFYSSDARDLMKLVDAAVSLNTPINEYVKRSTQKRAFASAYDRVMNCPVLIPRINVGPIAWKVDYDDFLAAVFRLRINRLTHDLLTPTGIDVIEWIHARKALQDNL